MGTQNWETKPDGRQIGRQDRRQCVARRTQHTPAKVKDKARWKNKWGEKTGRQSQMGDKVVDKTAGNSEADTAPQPR